MYMLMDIVLLTRNTRLYALFSYVRTDASRIHTRIHSRILTVATSRNVQARGPGGAGGVHALLHTDMPEHLHICTCDMTMHMYTHM